MASCCAHDAAALRTSRRLLWIVLVLNAGMFAVEAVAGWQAESLALQADALDFLGDSANYAIALFVLTRSVAWRAGSALAKGLAMVGFGGFLLIASLWHVLVGAAPEAPVMGVIGAMALLVNVVCATLLFRFRTGDANLRAVWLCSRNDAIGNLAVIAAAGGVFLTGTPWPDLAVGLVLAMLAIGAGSSVIRQARGELRVAAGAAAAE
jgi:cation diffusion facilitator family transporter